MLSGNYLVIILSLSFQLQHVTSLDLLKVLSTSSSNLVPLKIHDTLAAPLLEILGGNNFLNNEGLLVLTSENLNKIEANLLDILGGGGSSFGSNPSSIPTSDLLIMFGGNDPVLNSIQALEFSNILLKREAVIESLKVFSAAEQLGAKGLLNLLNVPFQSFWGVNSIIVKEGTLPLVYLLSLLGPVTKIRTAPKVTLSPIVSLNQEELNQENSILGVQWGIEKIGANQCWGQGVDGTGVTVANIDTGVRGTHEALAKNHRMDHGWFDPYTGTDSPDDGNGHGTHTMGTIAGQNGIGVAPGAHWIACRGCGSRTCEAEKLYSCGEWIMAPTNPDGSDPRPDLSPDVVSNSWGSAVGNDDWYTTLVNAWTASGIFSCFAIGNAGPACLSGGSPGDQSGVFSVGALDKNDGIASFSSKGPVLTTLATKPEICAPGKDIYSCWNTGDSAYTTISGTSMATPHVAGVAALLISKERMIQNAKSEASTSSDGTVQKNTLSFDTLTSIMSQTTDTDKLSMGANFPCDVPSLFNIFPNSVFGFGRCNAFKALTELEGTSQTNSNGNGQTVSGSEYK